MYVISFLVPVFGTSHFRTKRLNNRLSSSSKFGKEDHRRWYLRLAGNFKRAPDEHDTRRFTIQSVLQFLTFCVVLRRERSSRSFLKHRLALSDRCVRGSQKISLRRSEERRVGK